MNSDAPRTICVSIGVDQLEGYLDLPEQARGLVIFAHCGGSGRHNAMNNRLASLLWRQHIGTLLVDLIDWPVGSRDIAPDMVALADRLDQVTAWTRLSPMLRDLPRGYFGSGAGACAAIKLAATALDIAAMVMLDIPANTMIEELKSLKSPTLSISTDTTRQSCIWPSGVSADFKAAHNIVLVDKDVSDADERTLLNEILHAAVDWFERYFIAN